jgi:hypothetical protein
MQSPFLELHKLALLHSQWIPDDADREYFASDEFVERVQFQGEEGRRDQVAITLNCLQRLSLDPRIFDRLDQSRKLLEDGVVLLYYFGVSNPINMFELDPKTHGHALQQISAAVDANRESRMFRAAQSVHAWRSKPWGTAREDRILATLRSSLDWPKGSLRDFPLNSYEAQQWRAKFESNHGLLHLKAQSIQAVRQERLHLLTQAATPGANGGWTHLLLEIAKEALPRTDDERATPAEAPAA